MSFSNTSGHGARWKSAREFWEFFPDGKDEGLVCYDSRGPGGFDLADKELAVLLAEVAKNDRLCDRAAIVTREIAHAASGGKEAMLQFRPEFERLYWAELYWVELAETGQIGQSPLESEMVRFRRIGLQNWKLDNVSKTDLLKRAEAVQRFCNEVISRSSNGR